MAVTSKQMIENLEKVIARDPVLSKMGLVPMTDRSRSDMFVIPLAVSSTVSLDYGDINSHPLEYVIRDHILEALRLMETAVKHSIEELGG